MTTPKAVFQKGRRDATMTLTPTGRAPIEFRAKDTAGLIELLAKHILEAEAPPLAPEVPPRRLPDDAKRSLLDYWWQHGTDVLAETNLEPLAATVVRDLHAALAATRTPEPPDSDPDGRLIDTHPALGELTETIELELGMHNPAANYECDCGDQIKGETFWHHVAAGVDYRLTATDGDA